jgi:hypothetical protein
MPFNVGGTWLVVAVRQLLGIAAFGPNCTPGISPDLEFWLQAEQELTGKQTRERLGAWSLSPLCPHVRVSL